MARDKGKGSSKDDAQARRQAAAEEYDRKVAKAAKEHEAEVDKAGTHDDTYDKRKQW